MARSVFYLRHIGAFCFFTTRRNAEFASGSAPPLFRCHIDFFASFINILPRFASCAFFLFECFSTWNGLPCFLSPSFYIFYVHFNRNCSLMQQCCCRISLSGSPSFLAVVHFMKFSEQPLLSVDTWRRTAILHSCALLLRHYLCQTLWTLGGFLTAITTRSSDTIILVCHWCFSLVSIMVGNFCSQSSVFFGCHTRCSLHSGFMFLVIRVVICSVSCQRNTIVSSNTVTVIYICGVSAYRRSDPPLIQKQGPSWSIPSPCLSASFSFV